MEEKSILFQIKSIERIIARDLFMNVMNEDRFKTPTPTQMRIIDYILQSGKTPVYQKDLERVFNLRRATISGVLQTMEKNNLIVRSTSEDDNRTRVITLSPSTREVFDNNKKRLEKLEKEIIKDIDDKDLEVFTKVILKMKENIKNYEYVSSAKNNN